MYKGTSWLGDLWLLNTITLCCFIRGERQKHLISGALFAAVSLWIHSERNRRHIELQREFLVAELTRIGLDIRKNYVRTDVLP